MWDERYKSEEFVYGLNANDFLQAEYGTIKRGGRVLCLAEGEGRNAVFLAGQGYEVFAVDQSGVGLEKAKKLAEKKGVEIETITVDLAEFDFGRNQWDGIISIFAHVPSAVRKVVHRKLYSALKPNGFLILEAFTLRQLEMDGVGGPPAANKDFFMALEDLKKEIEPMSMQFGQELDRELSEGPLHHGRCAVVQLLAIKGQI